MTDSEILQWLVDQGAIDMAHLSYARITGDRRVDLIRDRIYELDKHNTEEE
jgi:hypothetical protein